ncbi:hypothetical protein AABB24_010130 [Solanum stoloniferum]|uniref:Uncharacterized protein n=1 Tax=Solanum stoloniferum TaxID=62892 RepID=A0ABD2UPZ5_9SOLN
MSMKELLESKHPTSWIEFEKGLISEEELTRKFFKDGRSFDMEGLKNCMRRGYSYLEGIEGLLKSLKENGYEIHAFTNYPIWYQMIEDELKLSNYLSWTFCSCIFEFWDAYTSNQRQIGDFVYGFWITIFFACSVLDRLFIHIKWFFNNLSTARG